jgi:hypothetical protein
MCLDVDSPQSAKEDSGLIDIFGMQQKMQSERAEALATQTARTISSTTMSEPPPAVTRDTSADLADFAAAAMGTSWTKRVRPAWIAGGVAALIAIVAIVSFSGGDAKDAKKDTSAAAATAPAAPPPPAPEPPLAMPAVPPPVAAAAPEPAKEVAKPASKKKHAKAKKAGSKLQKVSSSGTAS